jgi:peptidoglycan/xylan/chitin deacetylase (PgdA/CDA1 family)
VRYGGGLVSFTFDDFPTSAWDAGAPLLEARGAKGTYYMALKLLGTDGEVGTLATPEIIRSLHAAGHELGCHTYTHLNCGHASTAEILRDVERNAAVFDALIPGFASANFAYPYGSVSLAAKRALAAIFVSCRSIRPGINAGPIDFADLKANAIYHHTFDAERTMQLIDRNRACGGWLIFYTHDVRRSPSPYGCTPHELDAVVAYAAHRSRIVTIREAATLVANNGAGASSA